MREVGCGAAATPVRILSFDIGMRHLAYADVTLPALALQPAGAGTEGDEATRGESREQTTTDRMPVLVNRWRVLDVHQHQHQQPTGKGKGKGKSKNKSDPDDIISAIVSCLDEEFMSCDAGGCYDYVLLENQPSRKNPTMKSVQVALHTFFATWRHNTAGTTVGCVRLVAATRKLLPPPTPTPQSGIPDAPAPVPDVAPVNAAAAYRARKACAIARCRWHIADDPLLVRTLEGAKKRDDLADALLQAIWFASTLRPR
jgi:hypothetical protein